MGSLKKNKKPNPNIKMSIIVSSPEAIKNSPLNTSSAKALYSFPKASRFGSIMKKGDNPNAFYPLGNTISKRAASFGYGHKHDFTKQIDQIPAPNKYKDVDALYRMGKRGVSMGVGRDKVTFSGFTINPMKIPGPGAYDIANRNLPSLKGFSIKPKSESLKKHWNNPGPGHYNFVSTVSGEGKFSVSNYRNVTAPSIKMHTSVSKLKDESNLIFPGPGNYNQAVVKENSQSVLSNYHSFGGQSIGRQERP